MRIKPYSLLRVVAILLWGLCSANSTSAQYCTTGLYNSSNSYGCNDGDYINSFSTTGLSANITNLGTGCTNTSAADAYTNFSATMGASASPFQPVNFTIESGDYESDLYKIYVDWNQDQDFDDAGEEVYSGASVNTSFQTLTGFFNVPGNATVGLTRLRVRCVYSNTSFTACSVEDYGEIEDYAFTVVASPPCAGTPGVTTASGPATACSGAAIMLTASNVTYASGIGYEWQKYDGTNWNLIAGATTPVFVVTAGQTTASNYRFVTTCSNGGGQDISNTISIGMSPFYKCYCSPSIGTTLSSNGGANFIENVTIMGTTLNSSSTAAGLGGYSQRDPAIAGNTTLLIPGFNYTIDVGLLYGYDEVGGWMDFDGNGTFDVGEFIQFSGSTATFNVPSTAVSGLTGLRIRANDYGNAYTSADPCMDDGAGETEDYIVTIPVLSPCAGTPDPATAAGPATVCPGTAFSLSATGMSIGTGLNYEWQRYDGVNWVLVPGGTTPSFTVTTGQTAATDYRFVTNCTNGGGQDISNIITIGMSPFYNCYCSPVTGTTLSDYPNNFIENVTIVGTTLNATTTNDGPGGYTLSDPLVAGNTTTLIPGYNYTINVGLLYGYDEVGGWIDFDANGTFDVGEFIQFTGNTATFNVPSAAVAGQTALRIRANDYSNTYTSGDPCMNDGAGETEDYIITIPAMLPCAGTPVPATAAGPAGVCSGADFTLAASGMSIGTGIMYQWQSYDGTNWNPITGATGPVFTVSGGQTTATDYRFVTDCGNGGGQDISNIISVGMNPFYYCYCSPLLGTTLSDYPNNFIENVTITGTTLNSTTTDNGPGSYSLLDPAIAGNTATILPGMTYDLEIDQLYSGNEAAAWIDFDASGTYDAGELIQVTNGSATFAVPAVAVSGLTGMRIRVNDYGNTYTGGDACMNDGAGETEDYVLTIPTLAPCAGTPDAATASAAANACAGVDLPLTATGMTIAGGITYDWQKFDGTNWVSLPGGTSPTFTLAGGQTTTTTYRFVTTCNNGGAQDISNSITVGMNPFYKCYCSPLTGNTLSEYWGDNFIEGVNIPTTALNSSSTDAGTDGYSQLDPAMAGNTATLQAGVGYALNVSLLYNGNETAAWIDFNANGAFDASEFVQFTGNTATFTVPVGAVQGQTGMRIRVNDYSNAYTDADACMDDGAGETEDYVVTIAPPPACAQPNTLSATNITPTSAQLHWTEAGTATQWTIEYGVQGFTPGTGTFVSTTTNPQSVTVVPATNYTFYVRAICSSTDSSAQSIPSNFTTPCVNVVGAYAQSFNTSATPLCWTNTGPETWEFSNGSGPDYGVSGSTDHSGNGGYFAWVDGSGSGTNHDIALTSVPVDISGFTSPNLSYYMKSYNSDDGALNKLIVEAYTGTAWVQIDSVQMNFPTSGWYNRQVSLTSLAVPVVQIRFVVDESDNINGSSYYNDILLDDVNLLDGPLAIRLGDIAAVNVGARNRVDWNTITEEKGDGFIVERSADGRNYTQLATLSAKGQPSSYTYWDESPVNGINYYRLKMTDAAGQNAYSRTVSATMKGNGSFTAEAYPNPATDRITVKLYGVIEGNAQLTITDVTGKLLKTISVTGPETALDMSGLAQGVYLIKYSDDTHTRNIRVSKQ